MTSVDLQNVKKPQLDYRHYRHLTLENGLRVILVSDLKPGEEACNLESSIAQPKLKKPSDDEGSTKEDVPLSHDLQSEKEAAEVEEESESSQERQQAAACLTVGAGSFSDPPDCQGLAHYLEHMVFMGSEKYPEENDFHAYINQRGGQANAFTAAKNTVFFFNVRPKHFKESLDRFANFFISPLLRKDSMDRERTAVHSEYEMHRLNDGVRANGLLARFSKEGSPYAKFNCGSNKSLKEIPESRGIDIYGFLQEFRREMYSASLMTLSVIAKQSLSYLETMVREIFSAVPNNGKLAPDFKEHGLPLRPEVQGKLFKIFPVKDANVLTIEWMLPTNYPEYKCHILNVISYLMGHESGGSILSLLRKLGLAVELCAGCYIEDTYSSNEMVEMYGVQIGLTQEGLLQYERVIEVVFQYVNLLRVTSVPADVFAEYIKLREEGFTHKAVSSPISAVMKISQSMQRVDDLDWILAYSSLQKGDFDEEAFDAALAMMQAEKAIYLLASKKFEKDCTEVEEWYGCQFTMLDIAPEKLSAWNVSEPTAALHLPKQNKFLAKNFALLPLDGPTGTPMNLTDTLPGEGANYGILYYKMDKHFLQPKAAVNVTLWSPAPLASDKNIILHNLLLYAVNQSLLDISYYALEASLNYTLSGQASVSVQVHGFNDTLFALYDAILCALRDFTITDQLFEAYRGIFKQNLIHASFKANALSQEMRRHLLSDPSPLSVTLLAVLRTVTVEDLQNYHQTLLKSMRISAYAHGNLTAEQARQYFMHAVELLKFAPITSVDKVRVRQIPVGDFRVRAFNMNPEDVNTSITNIYQIGPLTIRESCILELIGSILSERAFNFLRTQEQLGYAVSLVPSVDKGIGHLMVNVASQTDKFTIEHCFEKIQCFMCDNADLFLANISDADLNDFIASAVARRKMDDTQMLAEVGRNITEILREEFVFNRREREIEALLSVTRADIQSIFKSAVLSPESRRHLSLQVESYKCKGAVLPPSLQDEWQREIRMWSSPKLSDARDDGAPVSEGTAGVCWLEDFSIREKWTTMEDHKIIV